MAGYDWSSNNALLAEGHHRLPASYFAKWVRGFGGGYRGCRTEDVRIAIPTREWHHTSNKFNRTLYYDKLLLGRSDVRRRLKDTITARKSGEQLMVVVLREDSAAIKHLDGMASMVGYKVASWSQKGTGRWRRWIPLAWHVPANKVAGIDLVGSRKAAEIKAKRSKAGKKAHTTKVVNRITTLNNVGIRAFQDSRTANAYFAGEISEWRAKLIAFKTRFRHRHTNYDELLHRPLDPHWDRETQRDIARINARVDAERLENPETWPEYLQTYEFAGKYAEALASTLKSPQAAHPIWFFKAMLALEFADIEQQINLANLTYEVVRDSITVFEEEALWDGRE